ncbi:hypothetical protein BLNAU_20137 [Blattamonas nauphoetae]|uniref:Uncharacterized protein n=1 Tax=Blattamonas nauphoetae TaxID=2049346 RepID=A0ABQ9WZK6_9EUKA|nr:hypothetical protein BLNAU_20137 [Blattamonas nauphoetae]
MGCTSSSAVENLLPATGSKRIVCFYCGQNFAVDEYQPHVDGSCKDDMLAKVSDVPEEKKPVVPTPPDCNVPTAESSDEDFDKYNNEAISKLKLFVVKCVCGDDIHPRQYAAHIADCKKYKAEQKEKEKKEKAEKKDKEEKKEGETPAEEAPAETTEAEETPAEETPAEETPAE